MHYEISTAKGLIKIEPASFVGANKGQRWLATLKDETILKGSSAEDVLAALLTQPDTDLQRLPRRLADWNQKRR